MKNPCWQCPDREITCHCHCEKYKVFCDMQEELRQKRFKIRETIRMSADLRKNLKRKAIQAR